MTNSGSDTIQHIIRIVPFYGTGSSQSGYNIEFICACCGNSGLLKINNMPIMATEYHISL